MNLWLPDFYQSVGIYGDGSDGNVTIDSGSGDVTLARNVFYENLEITDSRGLFAWGYQVFVRGTLLLNPATGIIANGADGGGTSDSIAGLASVNGTDDVVAADVLGGDGGEGGVSSGSDGTGAEGEGGSGGDGADGGNGSVGGPAFGAVGGTITTVKRRVLNPHVLLRQGLLLYGGAGGGGGGGGGNGLSVPAFQGGGGGAGGAGGGVLCVFARRIVNSSVITANGGPGGNGGYDVGFEPAGAGGGGGGGGWGGGLVIIVTDSYQGTGIVSADGGAGGSGGSAGTGGTNGGDGTPGQDGTVVIYNRLAGRFTVL